MKYTPQYDVLAPVITSLTNAYGKYQRNQAKFNILSGLGLTALALPVMAIKGFKPSFCLLAAGMFMLHKARQNEKRLAATMQLRHELLPKAEFNFPRPRP